MKNLTNLSTNSREVNLPTDPTAQKQYGAIVELNKKCEEPAPGHRKNITAAIAATDDFLFQTSTAKRFVK